MRSGRVVDLRKSKAGGHLPLPLPARGPERRRSPLRARRRKVRALIFFGSLLLIAGIVYGVSVVSYLPRFSIQTVEVNGAKEISASSIRSFVEAELYDGSRPILSRNNIFLYPRATIEQAVVDNFPRIRTVSVSRPSLLAQTVTVVVEEREPYARWCEGGECYLIDDGGFIFSQASTSAETLRTSYIFTGPTGTSTPSIGERLLPGRLAGVLALLDRLGQAGWNAESVSVENEQDFEIRLSTMSGSEKTGGFAVRASFGNDGEATVKNLELVLSSDALRGRESELEYVDLRFGNRVYYKLKGKEQQSTE
ncbi:MAG: hypothetical protein AAB665_02880 [Patescibacteria group bacterium]